MVVISQIFNTICKAVYTFLVIYLYHIQKIDKIVKNFFVHAIQDLYNVSVTVFDARIESFCLEVALMFRCGLLVILQLYSCQIFKFSAM